MVIKNGLNIDQHVVHYQFSFNLVPNLLLAPLIEMIGGWHAAFIGGAIDAQRYPLGSLLIGTALSFGFLPLLVDMLYRLWLGNHVLTITGRTKTTIFINFANFLVRSTRSRTACESIAMNVINKLTTPDQIDQNVNKSRAVQATRRSQSVVRLHYDQRKVVLCCFLLHSAWTKIDKLM